MFPSNYARHGDLVRQRIRNCHGDEMKHLDVVDGVIGATSLEARPPSAVIGDNIELLILHLRMPDAETWIAHTATHAVIRIEEQQIQDYLLISNGLMHRTPCVFSIKEETVDRLDDGLLEQLSREGIGLTDSSTMYIATAYVQHSYTELTYCLTFFDESTGAKQGLCLSSLGVILPIQKFWQKESCVSAKAACMISMCIHEYT